MSVCFLIVGMVRVYKRKTERGCYSDVALQKALKAVREENMSKKKASVLFGIPRTTLSRRLKEIHKPVTSLGRFKPVFDIEFENELVMHVVEMQQRFYGLQLRDLRSIAYELAEKNNVAHPFSHETKLAGKDWALNFLSRYNQLSLRKPEPTSMARLSGFNRVQVGRFFDILKNELETKKLTAKQIYNIDETGITTVQTPGKILAKKGCKQVGRVVSAERGTTTTVVCAMGAGGDFVPPMFLFKRKNMNFTLMNGCPVGSIGVPSPSGWMDSTLFVKYLEHFIASVKPTADNPVLIIVDGHQSHKTLEAIDLARRNHITMLTIPPHTSHRLQPLDLTFFGPLKTSYNREADKWMLQNPGRRLTDYQLCAIFSPAYNRVSNIEKAVKGFQCSGIFPFNPDVFDDEDFAPARVTEQALMENSAASSSNGTGSQAAGPPLQEPSARKLKTKKKSDNQNTLNHIPKHSRVTVAEICPYPHVNNTSSRKRRAESATLLTSTPYKSSLEKKRSEGREGKLKISKGKGNARNKLFVSDQLKLPTEEELQTTQGLEFTEVRPTSRKPQTKSVMAKSTQSKVPCLSIKKPRASSERKPLPKPPVWLHKEVPLGKKNVVLFFNLYRPT